MLTNITVNLGDDDAANDNDDIHLSSQVRWKDIKSNMKLNVVHISTWHVISGMLHLINLIHVCWVRICLQIASLELLVPMEIAKHSL
jgi:hypothetical protein